MSKDMPSVESLKIWHPSAALDHGLGGNHGLKSKSSSQTIPLSMPGLETKAACPMSLNEL